MNKHNSILAFNSQFTECLQHWECSFFLFFFFHFMFFFSISLGSVGLLESVCVFIEASFFGI